MPEVTFLMNFMQALGIIYIIAIILTIKKYKVLLLENYASNISLSNYKWLVQLATIIITLTLITLAKDILKVTKHTEIANTLTIIMLIGGLGFIFWIVLNALYFPDLFRGIDTKLQPVETLIARIKNTDAIYLNAGQEEKIKTLKAYMDQEEPYLEPSLTVQGLANQMKIPVRDLSILINHHLNQHFFDFVNEYRINKSMKLLKDPAKIKFTILEILYEVGFNSKSSFNTAFKKYTGYTPTEYRNNSL
ncbi:helix-turn-helix transcriptional regulator [Pedobacter nototheniae]|uniref:helix-turn-helix domain-containing protein n=1 Tax=Pedobacter nototheniae TaxID=2488994 RepID=UPI00293008F2|nr:helix-turn-helix transcriptional regulator [Pedobacter nototheniae]